MYITINKQSYYKNISKNIDSHLLLNSLKFNFNDYNIKLNGNKINKYIDLISYTLKNYPKLQEKIINIIVNSKIESYIPFYLQRGNTNIDINICLLPINKQITIKNSYLNINNNTIKNIIIIIDLINTEPVIIKIF